MAKHVYLLTIAVAITVAVAIAIRIAIEAAAIAVVVAAVIFRAPDLIGRQTVTGINKADRHALVCDARAADEIEPAGIGGAKAQTPGPPIGVGRRPLRVGQAIAVGDVAAAVVDAIVVILVGAIELADNCTGRVTTPDWAISGGLPGLFGILAGGNLSLVTSIYGLTVAIKRA